MALVGGVALAAAMLVLVGTVIGGAFGRPILGDSEIVELLVETAAYGDTLRANGHVVDDRALQDSATTLRFSNGRMSVTDGPFAETKEQLGGIMVLEANDLNHAIQLMSKLPCMQLGGCLEIRPINENVYGDLR